MYGPESDDGTRSGGLNEEIIRRKKELDDFKELQEKKYNELIAEINSLLPGAISAGLATAFKEMRESFDDKIKIYTALFYVTLSLIVIVSMIMVVDKITWDEGIALVKFTGWSELSIQILHHIPLIGPALWLALFSSKRRSEAQRLQQEYAHKETLAKSYQGFKQQIDSLNLPDKELMTKLLDVSISAIAFNASATLDGRHGDRMPAHELVGDICDKATPALDKLHQLFAIIRGGK